MKDALKWILLAAGGYLAIRATGITLPTFGGATNTESNGETPKPVDDGQKNSSTNQTTSTNQTSGRSQTTPSNQTTSTNQTNAAEREVIIRRAAAGDAASIQKAVALGIKFNADQWNWYRQQETGVATTVVYAPEQK